MWAASRRRVRAPSGGHNRRRGRTSAPASTGLKTRKYGARRPRSRPPTASPACCSPGRRRPACPRTRPRPLPRQQQVLDEKRPTTMRTRLCIQPVCQSCRMPHRRRDSRSARAARHAARPGPRARIAANPAAAAAPAVADSCEAGDGELPPAELPGGRLAERRRPGACSSSPSPGGGCLQVEAPLKRALGPRATLGAPPARPSAGVARTSPAVEVQPVAVGGIAGERSPRETRPAVCGPRPAATGPRRSGRPLRRPRPRAVRARGRRPRRRRSVRPGRRLVRRAGREAGAPVRCETVYARPPRVRTDS